MKKSKRQRKAQDQLIAGFIVLVAGGIYLSTDSLFPSIAAIIILLIVIGLVALIRKSNIESKYRQSGIEDIDKMDGLQFEHYLSALLKGNGYKATVTQGSGDYGADLILKKDGRKIVVQAKRYKAKVGIKAVQEIASAINHYTANEAWVITNSYFTSPAIKLAASNDVKLVNRDDLMNLIVSVQKDSSPTPTPKKVLSEVAPLCSKCKTAMVKRNGSRGTFYGCRNYPDCNETRSI
ncbi:restriction endonuclease [Terribacillus saccharophilus]|uniref:restriction endonuclease n=1 Tax=Terribacillus saccharophilus TaxID=361277 RepID=UPI002989CB03|nr:restriction endonuclease [Terribacillus saccharophilus]MCM3227532.1 restriction endonuclease [Terribacillus saccharophilus]